MSDFFIIFLVCCSLVSEVWLYKHQISDNPFVRLNRSIEDINDHIIRTGYDRIKYNETYSFGQWILYAAEVQVGPGLYGDFASIKLLEQPVVNTTEQKDKKGQTVTVFHYDIIAGLGFMFFDFDYEIKTLGLSWGVSEFMLDAKRNAMAVELEVWVWDNGKCKAFVPSAHIIRITRFVVTIQPRTIFHLFTNPLITTLADTMAPRFKGYLDEKVYELVDEIIPNSSFSDIVCYHFVL